MKYKIFILIVLISALFQQSITSQTKANFEEIITEISDVEEQVSVPKNKYLKTIKDELESRKKSLIDFIESLKAFELVH